MEILKSRTSPHSNVPRLITNPYDFVHNQKEAFKIKDLKVTEIRTEQDLLRVTSQDKPDIHQEEYLLQLQYHINGTRGHFLLVDNDGVVRTNGQSKDNRTFLKIIHNFTHRPGFCYQIVGWGTCHNQMILYMDGTTLKTRPYNPCQRDTNDDTFFAFRTKGNSEDGHYAILSWTGHPLAFDNQGTYLPPNNLSRNTDTMYLFKVRQVDRMKITPV
ncbi:uncharacterized protein LOC133173095 [Saccostrea echinata]|uniref:uncharacterized protein LOC133173095 n=1 Tax=Saccostrea echinata TaxID=191078 RepID=UPI002A83824E|nr:uncharacterized protein LOC133173095 [Saccostrea echinata]